LLKVAAPGSQTARTVLDLSSEVNDFLDRGFLGLAVDSDFEDRPYLYLLYTYDVNRASETPGPDAPAATVAQLMRVEIGPDNEILGQEVILGTYASGPCPDPVGDLDCLPADGTSHTIGTVLSAPDGTLFVGSGDAAGYNVADPLSLRAYDENSMAGKILHVDRDGRGLPGHAFCPSETELALVCTKVHAKGFRNPFRFTQLASGALLVADVGWNSYEELDLVEAGGGSYGWPCYEGPIPTPIWRDRAECQAEYAKEGTPSAHAGPIHSYAHAGANASSAVLAGPEYGGGAYPDEYRGRVFWGDASAGFLRTLALGGPGAPAAVGDFGDNLWAVDLTAAPNGDLAWVDLGDFVPHGAYVERLIYSPGNARPNAVMQAAPTAGQAPLTVEFDGSASSDPDGDALAYSWSFGDGDSATGAGVSHTYDDAGTFIAALTVADGRGRSDTDTLEVNVSNTPPVPKIDVPAGYRNGVPLTIRGSATDAEQGSLPPAGFEWQVRLVHHDHEHWYGDPQGVDEFSFTPSRDHDADSHYRVRLSVTDALGAVRWVEHEIHPETVRLQLRSVPPGAPVSYAGRVETTPWDTDAAVGFVGSVSVPESFAFADLERAFDSWSNGGARVQNLTIPAEDTTLTATYGSDAEAPVDPGGELWGPGGSGAEPAAQLAADTTGPRIRPWRPRRRPRFLAGLVRDPSGVRAMRVAVAARRRAGCRWLARAGNRFGGLGSCSARRWLAANVDGNRWTLRLPRRLRTGRYRAWLMAVDALGNESRAAVDGRRSLTFKVGPPQARASWRCMTFPISFVTAASPLTRTWPCS
jgi:PKD repeat protein